MADTIRDVVIRLTIQQQDFKAKGIDLGEIRKSLAEREKLFADSFKKTEDLFKKFSTGPGGGAQLPTAQFEELQKKVAELEKKLAGLGEQTAKFKTQSQTSMLGALDGFKAAGEGAFILARGIAFLASDSDESFRTMLQNVARVQGAFDVFKGGIDTAKGLANSLRQLGGEGGAMGGLEKVAALLFAPKGLLVAGAAAAAAGIYHLTREYVIGTAAAERYSRATEQAVQRMQALRQQRLDRILAGSEEFARRRSAERSTLGERLGLMRTEGLGAQRLLSEVDFERDRAFARLHGAASRILGIQPGDPLIAGRTVEFAQSQIANPNIDLERRLAMARELRAFQEQDMQLAREQIRLREEYLRSLHQERDQKARALDVVKQQLEAERQRVANAEAALGRLGAEDFMSLRNIADRVSSGGQINRVEAEFLERTGLDFAQQHAQQFFQAEGQRRGFSEIARAFGATDRRGEFEQQAQELQEEIARINGLADRVSQTLAMQARDLREALERTITENVQGAIERLRQELEARRQEQRSNS